MTFSQGFTLGYSHRLPLGGARCGYNGVMSDSAEVVARAFADAISRQDVEELVGLMTPGHRFVDSLGGVTEGRETMRAAWVRYFRMVPDFEVVVEEIFCDGKSGNAGPSTALRSAQDDKLSIVVMLGKARGTYCHPSDEDLSPGTPGKSFDGKLKAENRWETPAAWRAVVEGGLVAEWRVYTDNEPMRELMRRAG
jgi:limonene-1,2-epoxide hydrolase